jgi:hypothetical protein
MMTAVAITRETGDGKYADVLDVIEALAEGDYGSGSNAAVVMIRQSDLYKETIKKLPKIQNQPAN